MGRWLKVWLLLALFAPAMASAAPSYYGWAAGAFLQGPEAEDLVAPTVVIARISDATLTVRLTEVAVVGAGGSGGMTVTSCSGGAVTPTYVSAGITLTFSLSRTVDPSETGCVLGYTQPGDGFEDAAGNDLATFSGTAISFAQTTNCPVVLGSGLKPGLKASVRQPICAN